MKKLIIILPLLLILGEALAQVTKFRSEYFASSMYNEYTSQWREWSDWSESNILMTFDMTNTRFTIYSKKTQEYDIIDIGEKEYLRDREEVFMRAIDEDGLRCSLKLVSFDDGTMHLYIYWSDARIVYQLRSN
jgi:hypothetical protein